MMETVKKNTEFTCKSCFRFLVLKNSVCFDNDDQVLLCEVCCDMLELCG